ncbi:MAG: hypothetical protein WCX30_00940 [Candidatus Paceibacterota bacterium]|jgi:hypothetical protein|nr:hypothetical protein [bacterium]
MSLISTVTEIIPGKINFTSPEAIFILYPVIFIEVLGLLFILIGDDYGILDIILSSIVWPWLLANGKVNPNKLRRQIVTTIGEILPLVGFLPLWSWSVWKALEEDYRPAMIKENKDDVEIDIKE